MKISILIPTKNRLPILRETLHNIYFVNKLPKEDFEVIVSNDGDDILSVLYNEFPFDNLKIVKILISQVQLVIEIMLLITLNMIYYNF